MFLFSALYQHALKDYPQAEKFIKILIGAEEFLHNKKRFCLWLVDANPSEIKKIPPIYERIKKCREDRLKGANDRKKLAETPHLFREQNNPKNFLFFPQVSSERRKYIPIGFFDEKIIAVNPNFVIPDADLFLFGILQSSVHMAFTKKFCGRLKSDLRYSNALIYNNFPFPDCEKNFHEKISETAEKILEVRKKYLGVRNEGLGDMENEKSKTNPSPLTPSPCLADLYDPILMPKDLRDAHKKNDLAVMEAYGFDKNFSESEILAELMKLYQNLTEK